MKMKDIKEFVKELRFSLGEVFIAVVIGSALVEIVQYLVGPEEKVPPAAACHDEIIFQVDMKSPNIRCSHPNHVGSIVSVDMRLPKADNSGTEYREVLGFKCSCHENDRTKER